MDIGNKKQEMQERAKRLEVVKDDRNLYHSLYKELYWKNHGLRTKHWYLDTLANNGPRSAEICGTFIIDLCKELDKPSVLDVGCGPISSIAYLQHEDLAEVTGIDVIADSYAELLARYDIKSPCEQINVTGEETTELGRTFDITFCRNALDHHLAPALAWLNMFRSSNRFIVQSHSLREGTKEGWKQLHQYDLFLDEDNELALETRDGARVNLTRHMPLSIYRKTVNVNDDGTGWMTVVYEKQDGEIDGEFFKELSTHLWKVLSTRNDWALKVEKTMLDEFWGEIEHAPLNIRPVEIKI